MTFKHLRYTVCYSDCKQWILSSNVEVFLCIRSSEFGERLTMWELCDGVDVWDLIHWPCLWWLQVERVLQSVRSYKYPLEKYIALMDLQVPVFWYVLFIFLFIYLCELHELHLDRFVARRCERFHILSQIIQLFRYQHWTLRILN